MRCPLIKLMLCLSALLLGLTVYGGALMFEPLDLSDGLSDNNIRFINSLPDGRIVFTTEKVVNIYDGIRFQKYPLSNAGRYELRNYRGHNHLYLGCDTILWIKNHHSLSAFDLRKERYLEPGVYLAGKGIDQVVDDLFLDSSGRLWVAVGDNFIQPDSGVKVLPPKGCGEIQDLEVDSGKLYLFDNKGTVHCYGADGKYEYSRSAYAPEEASLFGNTSLVVKSGSSFYQLRNGSKGAFLKFDISSGRWQKILERDYSLNTLMIADDGKAYITCRLGFIVVDLKTGEVDYLPYLRTRRGNVVATEISTVFQDACGTLWMGTLNRGLLYCNPGRYQVAAIDGLSKMNRGVRNIGDTGRFWEDRSGNIYVRDADGVKKLNFIDSGKCEAVPLPAGLLPAELMGEYGSDAAFLASDGSVCFNDTESGCMVFKVDKNFYPANPYSPLLSEVYLYGEKVEVGKEYHGRILLPVSEPYIKTLVLRHDQNFITLKFSPVDFLNSSGINYSYKLDGFDRDWVDVRSAQLPVRDLTAQYTNLPPGKYVFRIRTYDAANPVSSSPEASLDIEILTPWYRTPIAYMFYVLAAVLIGWFISWMYVRYQRRIMERKHREEILLVRIKSLIEQCDRYEAERNAPVSDEKECESLLTDETKDDATEEENAFVAKAVRLVEENMDTPGYSVEQLSRDLCMERTGLYKKLVTLLNQSPSLFMRNIRLKHAAEMLAAREGSVAEIAMRTGFSNASYFSKCFQEVYGCRPSEFADKK